MNIHFGCKIMTDEPYLTRENYIHLHTEFEKWYGKYKSDIFDSFEQRVKFCEDCALLNYDLNMAYYESLDENKFKAFIKEKLEDNPDYIQVEDLNQHESPGLYVMVAGRYKRIYIGISMNVKKRILVHWRKWMDLSRLIFAGGISKSKLSIDSFRALDTTQIFLYRLPDDMDVTMDTLWDLENKIVNDFPREYLCNRMLGGNPDELIMQDKETWTMAADLPDITEKNIKTILPNTTWEDYCETVFIYDAMWEDIEKYSVIRERKLLAEARKRARERQKKAQERKKKSLKNNKGK